MNPAEIANVARVRIPVNICRCCLVEDSYRDISYKYYYSGGKEIYEEMLYETFNIQISEHDGCTRLICDRCVTRLRDAYEFKQMVQQNENSFGGYLESWNQNAVKIELLNDDLNNPTADLKVDDKHEPANSTDNDGLSNIKSTPNGDDNISGDVRVKLKRSYTEALDTLEKKSKRVFEEDTMKLDIEPVTIKSELIVPIENELSTEDYNDVFSDQQPNLEIKVEIEHPDNDIPIEHFADGQHCDDVEAKTDSYYSITTSLRNDSLKLLQYSTLLVFQWHMNDYKCFCCSTKFNDMDTLRNHTDVVHTIEDIERKIIFLQNRIFKVDITIISCKLCWKSLDTVESLKEHLKVTHEIHFEMEETLIVPFKVKCDLSDGYLRCQLCDKSFKTFNILYRHSYKHINKYNCNYCKFSFVNLNLLKSHLKAHGKKNGRYHCPYCPEGYNDDIERVQHLIQEHGGEVPKYKCNICSELFHTASLLKIHKQTKMIHKQTKDKQNVSGE